MSVRLFKSLLFKSAQIQKQIEQEQQRCWPDRYRLLKLKKIRLSIADRIQRLIQIHQRAFHQPVPQLQPVRIKRR